MDYCGVFLWDNELKNIVIGHRLYSSIFIKNSGIIRHKLLLVENN